MGRNQLKYLQNLTLRAVFPGSLHYLLQNEKLQLHLYAYHHKSIDYCDVVWVPTTSSHLKRLERVLFHQLVQV